MFDINYVMIFLVLFMVVYVIKTYSRGTKCPIRGKLQGKIIFITGGNTGIGRETAIELSKMGAQLLIGARDMEKAKQVISEIGKLGLIKPLLFKLDLSDLRSVESCVEKIKQASIKKIDILINNAGVMALPKRQLSKQGYEVTFATNHLGHFHLTNLLIPLLKEAQKARIINVASIAHLFSDVRFDDINCDSIANSIFWPIYYSYIAYGSSKTANILHAIQLNQIYQFEGIKAVSLHPGVVRTEILRNQMTILPIKIFFQLFWWIYAIFTKNSYEGAQTTIYCAIAEYSNLEGGGFYKECQLSKAKYSDLRQAQKLWNLSQDMVAWGKEK